VFPVNIGNPDEVSILQTAQEVIDLIPDSKSKIVFRDLPKDDPKIRRPDISKAKEILNWSPTIDRQKGLKMVSEYFKSEVALSLK